MIPESLIAALVCGATAAAGGVQVPRLVSRLPEPTPTDTGKTPYAELAERPRLGSACAIIAGGLAAAMGASRGLSADLPVWVFLAVLGVTLGFVDWRTQLLPARLVAPAYVVVGGLLSAASAVTWSDGGREALIRAGISWGVVFGVYFVLWFVHPRGLGYGDVRLSGVLGMALGWLGSEAVVVGTYAAFLLGAVLGGLLALARVVDRKGYPFGPFMLVGAFFGVLHAGGDLVFWR
ncbi:hypothetical protein BH24ACT11_BH24ACT11_15210 [soil metagenome]